MEFDPFSRDSKALRRGARCESHAALLSEVSESRLNGNRRGYTLLELMTAMILLGTATATIVPVIGWANAQRRAAEFRQIAVLEASNIVERLSTRRWEDVTPEALAKLKLSPAAARSLRDPLLTIRVASVADNADGKRISLELRWKNREGDTVVPVRLTRFLYRRRPAP